ncbi:hypothetical protein [Methylobacter tundripaludum]|uniref:hypothetical protein n=1 Tax=Methylobacter tundripaludum TaxID=173365 RepID=UPI0004DF1DFB|nr:hypothetical protein [Methylobacter tundripaludum]
MNAQSAKTPTPRESVTITLTPDQQELLLRILGSTPGFYVPGQETLYNDLSFLFSNIGDACATPAHIPEAPGQGGTLTPKLAAWIQDLQDRTLSREAPGQGGTIICHHCDGDGTYTKPNVLKLFQCEICRGAGFISVDSVGQGGNQ